jgi:outer membrane lipoprotein-sorting protein
MVGLVRRVAVAGIVATVLSPPIVAQQPSVEETINGYYQAVGGLDRIRSVMSRRMTGHVTGTEGTEATVTLLLKRPMKMRSEFTVEGTTNIQAFDGDQAWMIAPMMGQTEPMQLPADIAEAVRGEADFDGPLVDYEQKGNRIRVLGTDEVEGVDAVKLEITLQNGAVTIYYLDARSLLPIKTASDRTVQGMPMHVETLLGDYREVGGLMVPFSIRILQGGEIQTLTIDTIEHNIAIDDALFRMPRSGGT